MATHDYVIDNASGSAVRTDLNNVFQAILTNNSSGSAPSTTAAYMLWADTSNNILKMRNSSNNAWINLFTLSGGIDVDAASNFAAAVTFTDDVTFDGATAGRDIVFDRSDNALEFADEAKATFGAGADLQIYHDGTLNHSYIYEVGSGNLRVRGHDVEITDTQGSGGGNSMAKFIEGGAVELFFNNSKKAETVTGGFTVTGTCTATAFAGDGSALTGVGGGVTSDSQQNTKAGSGAGDAFSGTDAEENTLFGYNAGNEVTTGDNNTFFGREAGGNVTTTANNTAIGHNALNAGTTIGNCTAIGASALAACTVSNETAVGYNSLKAQTSGTRNVALGYNTGQALQTGANNTFIGYEAGLYATGNDNVLVGKEAGHAITSAGYGVVVGSSSGKNITTGTENTIIGNTCGHNTTTGGYNFFGGRLAGERNTTGSYNIHIGYSAGRFFTSAGTNVFIGQETGKGVENSSTGQQNTCVGKYSATGLTSGSENTMCGNNLGNYITTLTTGTRNTLLGQYSRTSAADSTQEIVIGYNIAGKGNFTAFIGNGSGVYNGANSSSWSTTSDRRIKKNIQDNTTGLDKINQIQVRNFEYRNKEEITDFENSDAAMVDVKGVQVGVIAQEIQEVLPDVVKELSTGVLTVNPDNVTWYLVNAVKELSAKVTALEAG